MPKPNATATPGALDTAQTSPAVGHATFTPEKVALLRPDLTPAPTVIEWSYEKTEPDIAPAAAVYRSGWLMWGTVFLLVLLAVSAFLYLRQPGKNILTPDTKPLVQTVPAVPAVPFAPTEPAAPMTPAESAEAPQVDVVVTPADTPRTTPVGANAAGKVSRAVPPSAG